MTFLLDNSAERKQVLAGSEGRSTNQLREVSTRAIRNPSNSAMAEAESIADGAGGATVDKDQVLADFRNLIRTMKDTQPHVICPYCHGVGKDAENSKKKCAQCKGAMYLDKIQFKNCPEDIKKTVPGYTEKAGKAGKED